MALDGPGEFANESSAAFLGDGHFHRLDPPLLGPPEEPSTLIATAYARFPMWQQYLLERQRIAAGSIVARRAVQKACGYLKEYWYDREPE